MSSAECRAGLEWQRLSICTNPDWLRGTLHTGLDDALQMLAQGLAENLLEVDIPRGRQDVEAQVGFRRRGIH